MATKYIPLDDDLQNYITTYMHSIFVVRHNGCYIRGVGDNGRVVGPIPPPEELGYEAVGLFQRYHRWYWKMVEV
jgi:hypothetical protein